MNWFWVTYAAFCPPLLGAAAGLTEWRLRGKPADEGRRVAFALWTFNATVIALINGTAAMAGGKGAWQDTAAAAISALVGAWFWYRRRKRRDRAESLIGAKSRALRDAVAARAREASRGLKPSLRPVPQGAA